MSLFNTRAHYRRMTHARRAALEAGAVARLFILVAMTTWLSLADVSARLPDLVSRVNDEHARIIVTVHGQPSAVLMARRDLDALEETIAILSEHEALRRIISSDHELNSGDGGVRVRSRRRNATPEADVSTAPIEVRAERCLS